MKILVTGGNGFLGKKIVAIFQNEEVMTLGRSGNNINCDLAHKIPKLPVFDVVIHAAGKAHSVPKTSSEKQEFFDINAAGTSRLLAGLEASGIPKSFILISSVSVYGKISGIGITESEEMKASDPYGLSKIEAEHIVNNWCTKNNVVCTILRLPLVIAEDPPGNFGAMIGGIEKGYFFTIQGGNAKKSMVLAQDVAALIPRIVSIGGVYNLTDGHHPTIKELSKEIAKQLNKKKPYNMPKWVAFLLAKLGDIIGPKFPINSDKLKKIVNNLTFDDSKARQELTWNPGHVLKELKIK